MNNEIVKIFAYKQGNNWMVKINDVYTQQLHYSVRTAKDVRNWVDGQYWDAEYKLTIGK